jgi:hypothetical protein
LEIQNVGKWMHSSYNMMFAMLLWVSKGKMEVGNPECW